MTISNHFWTWQSTNLSYLYRSPIQPSKHSTVQAKVRRGGGHPCSSKILASDGGTRHPIPQMVAGGAIALCTHGGSWAGSLCPWSSRWWGDAGRNGFTPNLVQPNNLLTARWTIHKSLHTQQTKRCVSTRLCSVRAPPFKYYVSCTSILVQKASKSHNPPYLHMIFAIGGYR